MKLSNAQEKVLKEAYKDIDRARNFENHADWLKSIYPEWIAESHINDPFWVNAWEENVNGIVLTHCNTKTLEALAKLGYIEIIRDSTGERFGIDKVKILNY